MDRDKPDVVHGRICLPKTVELDFWTNNVWLSFFLFSWSVDSRRKKPYAVTYPTMGRIPQELSTVSLRSCKRCEKMNDKQLYNCELTCCLLIDHTEHLILPCNAWLFQQIYLLHCT